MNLRSFITSLSAALLLITAPLQSGEITIPLANGEIPHNLSLPTGPGMVVNVITARFPINTNPTSRSSWKDLMKSVKASEPKTMMLQLFWSPQTNSSPEILEIAEGGAFRSSNAPLFATYHLNFKEDVMTITPHFASPQQNPHLPAEASDWYPQPPYGYPHPPIPPAMPYGHPGFLPMPHYPYLQRPMVPAVPVDPSFLRDMFQQKESLSRENARLKKLLTQATASARVPEKQISPATSSQPVQATAAPQAAITTPTPQATSAPSEKNENPKNAAPYQRPRSKGPAPALAAQAPAKKTELTPKAEIKPTTQPSVQQSSPSHHQRPRSKGIAPAPAAQAPVKKTEPTPNAEIKPAPAVKPLAAPVIVPAITAPSKKVALLPTGTEEEQDFASLPPAVPHSIVDTAEAVAQKKLAEKQRQEEVQRKQQHHIAEKAQKATLQTLLSDVEKKCKDHKFADAFEALAPLGKENLRNPVYIKRLLALVKALSVADAPEVPAITNAVRELAHAQDVRNTFIVYNIHDRRMLFEYLAKHASDENKEQFLHEAATLGSVKAGTHWHLLQMKKNHTGCKGGKNCPYRKALLFFEEHATNKDLLAYLPRYYALIEAAQNSHQKDSGHEIIQKTVDEASKHLSELECSSIKTLANRSTQEPAVESAAAEPGQAEAEIVVPTSVKKCKALMLKEIEKGTAESFMEAFLIAKAFAQRKDSVRALLPVIGSIANTLTLENNNQNNYIMALALVNSCFSILVNDVVEEQFERSINELNLLKGAFDKLPRMTLKAGLRLEQLDPEVQFIFKEYKAIASALNPLSITVLRIFFDYVRLSREKKTDLEIKIIVEKKTLELMEKVGTQQEALDVIQAIEGKSEFHSAFSSMVKRTITQYLLEKNKPELYSLWSGYLTPSNYLTCIREECCNIKNVLTSNCFLNTSVLRLLKIITTPESAQHFVEELTAITGPGSQYFCNSIRRLLSHHISTSDQVTKDLWGNLLEDQPAPWENWCTIL